MKNELYILVTGAALVLACTSAPKAPVQGVTTTGAGIVSNADAASRLAQAQCDHAQTCNQLGKDKDYADHAGCMSQVGHEMEKDYQPSKCPHGVREERLNSCVNAFKNESCGNLGDKIARAETCRRGNMCIE